MTELIDMLLENDLVPVGSVLTVKIPAKTAFGHNMRQTRDMVLEKIMVETDQMMLTMHDHERSMTTSTNMPKDMFEVLAIDGMSMIRFAELYDINADGSNRKVGKKRGRKSKALSQ